MLSITRYKDGIAELYNSDTCEIKYVTRPELNELVRNGVEIRDVDKDLLLKYPDYRIVQAMFYGKMQVIDLEDGSKPVLYITKSMEFKGRKSGIFLNNRKVYFDFNSDVLWIYFNIFVEETLYKLEIFASINKMGKNDDAEIEMHVNDKKTVIEVRGVKKTVFHDMVDIAGWLQEKRCFYIRTRILELYIYSDRIEYSVDGTVSKLGDIHLNKMSWFAFRRKILLD